MFRLVTIKQDERPSCSEGMTLSDACSAFGKQLPFAIEMYIVDDNNDVYAKHRAENPGPAPSRIGLIADNQRKWETQRGCEHQWLTDPTSHGLIDVCAKCGAERA